MDNRIVIPILAAAAVAYACGPWRHTPSSAPPVAAQTRVPTRAKHEVVTDFNVVPTHAGVDFALSVRNHTKKTVELRFPNGKTHDFVVLDSAGRVVWRWSDGRMFTQSMQSKAVKASDTLTIQDSWDPRNAHGTYVAIAMLNTDAAVQRRVSFKLP